MAKKKDTQPRKEQSENHWLEKGAISRELSAVRAQALFGVFRVGILGTQPLILHRFGEKSAKQMLDKQCGVVKKTSKPPRDLEAEVASSAYMISGEYGDEGARYGMPTAGFKHAAVSVARHLPDINMTQLRQQFFILPDVGRLSEFWFDEARGETDIVRIGKLRNIAENRVRPYFYGWRTLLTIRFWKDVISPQQILQCLELGGTIDGYGEFRPGKSNSGWAGTWSCITEVEFDQLQSGAITTAALAAKISEEEQAA